MFFALVPGCPVARRGAGRSFTLQLAFAAVEFVDAAKSQHNRARVIRCRAAKVVFVVPEGNDYTRQLVVDVVARVARLPGMPP